MTPAEGEARAAGIEAAIAAIEARVADTERAMADLPAVLIKYREGESVEMAIQKFVKSMIAYRDLARECIQKLPAVEI